MRQYKQLTQAQRYHIEALLQVGHNQTEVAKQIGVHKATISRELKRNKAPIKQRYLAQYANIQARKRRYQSRKPYKMVPRLVVLIEAKLQQKWSPEQISGWLARYTGRRISHERIYQHVYWDKARRGRLFHHLRHRNKRYCRRGRGHSRNRIKNRCFIDYRPALVNTKQRYGDWEADTMIGQNRKSALVTVVERKSQLVLIKKLSSKTAQELKDKLIQLLQPLTSLCHTLTNDNGTEFALHEQIAQALQAQVYFAHPYRACERGLNEQVNGLIRQYLPKKTDFTQVSEEKIRYIMHQLNNRPRKLLGFATPKEVLQSQTQVILDNLWKVALHC